MEPEYAPGTAHALTKCSGKDLPRRYKAPKYTQDVGRFVSHKRNRNVSFYESGECFIYKDRHGRIKTIRGLTALMARQFYPPTASQMGKPKNKPVRKKQRVPAEKGSSLRGKGKGVGSLWDENVYALIRDTRKRGKTLGTQVHGELSDYANMPEDEWLRKYTRPNVYTIKAIRALSIWKLEPLAGEWPIYDEDVPYSTSIDMVCVNGRGQVVLVEFKTGYEGTFEMPSYAGARLRTPLGRLKGGDCPRNKAMLQISLARATLMRKYALRNPLPLVVRIHARGVTHHWVDPYFIEKQTVIYTAFSKKRVSASALVACARPGPQKGGKKRKRKRKPKQKVQ